MLSTLSGRSLWNILTGKGIIRAGYGSKEIQCRGGKEWLEHFMYPKDL